VFLVFGASGYVGRNLVPWLASRGHRIRAVARSRAALEAEGWTGVETTTADALDPESLPPVLAGVSVAYFLVHSMTAGRDFPERDRQAAANFAAAAAAAGVGRIVYLGGLAPEAVRSLHLASRSETGEVLRSGSVPVVELRAGIIVGPGSAAFEVMRDLVAHLPVMVTPRWVRALSPPIALEDLLGDLEALADATGAEGRILEAGGPDRLTYEAMMRRVASALGRREPLILPVPVLTPELSALWLGLVTTVPAPLARALIGGMRHDLAADDRALRTLVPRACMGIDAAIDRALALERGIVVHDRWRDGALALRGGRADRSFYGKRMRSTATATAPPDAVWRVLGRIGTRAPGDVARGLAWRLRFWLDRRLGGRDAGPRESGRVLAVGDRFGTWSVVAALPGTRLTIMSALVAPGAGGLEIDLAPEAGGTRVTATIHWHPGGLPGLLYWYALWLPHRAVLPGFVRAIVRQAESAPLAVSPAADLD
jgi:uncharacterized protein YbjT (DUF2867 family)